MYTLGRILRYTLIVIGVIVVVVGLGFVGLRFLNPTEPAVSASATTPVLAADLPKEEVAAPAAEVLPAVEEAPALAPTATAKPLPTATPFTGTIATLEFKGGLPAYLDMRNDNRVAGDESMYVIKFMADFPRIAILRLVCDDNCISAQFYSSPNAAPVDLLPLLGMGVVDKQNPADPELRRYMKAHGVNLNGEQLAQNYYSVLLGKIMASDGAYITVVMKDDPKLEVNNGGLISFTSDTEVFTNKLDNSRVTDPTFVLEQ